MLHTSAESAHLHLVLCSRCLFIQTLFIPQQTRGNQIIDLSERPADLERHHHIFRAVQLWAVILGANQTDQAAICQAG